MFDHIPTHLIWAAAIAVSCLASGAAAWTILHGLKLLAGYSIGPSPV